MSVATVANVAAALADSGATVSRTFEVLAAAAVILLVTAVGVGYAGSFGGRWSVSVAIAWGFAWVAYGRLTRPRSRP